MSMLSILMATAATTSPLSAASLDQHMAAIYEESFVCSWPISAIALMPFARFSPRALASPSRRCGASVCGTQVG